MPANTNQNSLNVGEYSRFSLEASFLRYKITRHKIIPLHDKTARNSKENSST